MAARGRDDYKHFARVFNAQTGYTEPAQPWGQAAIRNMYDCASMGEAYNLAYSMLPLTVKYPDVCVFTHTDVELWAGRKQWDDMLEKAMLPDVGFVGVAGATGYVGGAWWAQQGAMRGAVAHTTHGETYTSTFGPYGDVDVLDGVFMAAKRSVVEAILPWPEDLGWHFYDIYATLKAKKLGLRNVVVPLPLLHGSVGLIGSDWSMASEVFRSKYLPGLL